MTAFEDGLRQIVREELRECFSQPDIRAWVRLKNSGVLAVNTDTAAQMLDVEFRAVRRLMRQGAIPRLFFPEDEDPYAGPILIDDLCQFALNHPDTWQRYPRYGQGTHPVRLEWQSLSHHLRPRILERDGYRCQNCGDMKGPFHIDHIQPVVRGGTNDEENLQTLCRTCNTRKGAKWTPTT